jgi:hypothetical protein
MKAIIDRFGEDVETQIMDSAHFKAIVEIYASPTFFAWVFAYAGKIHILSPQKVVDEYKKQLTLAMKNS